MLIRRASMVVVMGAIVVGDARDAEACGACFASSSESTIVNDHRMALLLSPERTILWDTISYSGNPKEFAYVVPVRRGTRLEGSKEAWFGALDASTRPIIMSPQSGGFGGGGGGGGGMGGADGYDSYGGRSGGSTHGGGCGCQGQDDMASFDSESAPRAGASNSSSPSAGSGGGRNGEGVDVVTQSVVGPYEAVTLHATDPKALDKWLDAHGYAIPDAAHPIIDDYVTRGFDFIALRLAPGEDVRAMEPIRIVSPGLDATLPLRMMQIGVGAKVGITLYVISEGRYHPANFPDLTIDFTKLIWDYGRQRSNYQELSQAAMASGDGRGFLTEYAKRPDLRYTGAAPAPGMMSNPGLADAYKTTCRPGTYSDAGVTEWDSGGDDAGDDAGILDDAGVDDDAGAPEVDAGPPPPPPPWTPKQCDDLEVALENLHEEDVWITRMRATLPYAALNDTLRFEAAPVQSEFDNVHYATGIGTIPGARIARATPGRSGTWALVLGTAFVVMRLLRRRRA